MIIKLCCVFWGVIILSGHVALPSLAVEIQNCGQTVQFSTTPQRVLVNDLNLLEMLLELGLEQSIVGYSGVSGFGATTRIAPRHAYWANRIPEIAPKYPSLEQILSVEPDLMVAGWFYGFAEGGITPLKLKKFNIQAYVLEESCAFVQSKKSGRIEDLYQDFLNLGQIFAIEKRAEFLVNNYRQQIAALQHRLKGVPKTRVFVYDSGEKTAFSAGGLAIISHLIELSGGQNILKSIKKSWVHNLEWESILQLDPEVVLMFDYNDIKQKKSFFRTHPVLKHLTAVQNDQFIAFTYNQLVPGIHNVQTAHSLARFLHPNQF